MIGFAYYFTLLSIAVTLLGPLLVPPETPGAPHRPIGFVVGCAAGDRKPDDHTPRAQPEWMVNLGGWMADDKSRVIQGGLACPLYFVVLALMGGAVSLARRVPELQKRADPTYTPTEQSPKLSAGDMRDYLTFQIMQFISAPLIAMTAFHVVGLTSRPAIAALGFSAGFGSEAILLLIRGAVEKISPSIEPTSPTGSVSGVVKKAGAVVPAATVRVVGHPALTVSTGTDGAFVINAIPVGERVLETANGAGTTLTRINVEARKAVTYQIDL